MTPLMTTRALSPVAVRLLPPRAAAALSESGALARARSGASPRPVPVGADRDARIESGRLQREVGRTRLLPFDLVLTQAQGVVPLFRAGPFDELRLFERLVTSRHDTEWVQRAAPGDLARERFQPFGVLRLGPAHGRPVPELARSPRLVAALRAALGPDGVLAARRLLAGGPPSEAGASRRPGGPAARTLRPADAAALEAARTRLDDLARIAWLESAFAAPPAGDAAAHRYYLGSHLRTFLVRHDRTGKRLFVAEPAGAARGHGLIVYLDRAA
jgi:hypothetical protein